MTTTLPSFVRDRFTWLAYFMLAYYAYTQAALGPLIPFLRDELSLNYTLSGLHLSAFAVGMIAAGSTADRVAQRFGRAAAWWGGGAGMALGAILLTFGRHPVLTVSSAFLMGFIGSYLLVMVQATLSDRHSTNRAFALTEANVFASLSAMLAPLAVGAGQSLGIGWRLALYTSAASWLLVAVFNRRVTLPGTPPPCPLPASREGEKTR